ncbi:MAG: CTP synthase [Candidatus Helarchaeota archaeon]
MTKYIFVTGGVMSAIGKGVTSSSIGKLFQFRNYDVSIIKIDPYLNVDPGTLNPVEHGEVFVTEEVWDFQPVEGGPLYRISEIDQDFGTYERFLGKDLHPSANITSGQVYLSVILKERFGSFLGKTIQIIPHITDEIKNRIYEIGKQGCDILITEIGGTVGDIEAMPFLEAIRQFRIEEHKNDTVLVHVTLVPYSESVGELKTKPTQHSVRVLQGLGLQPDVIVGRANMFLPDSVKRKISLYCNVPENAVISNPQLESIYELPLIFERQGLGQYLSNDLLSMVAPKPEFSTWEKMVENFKKPNQFVKIAMPGKYTDITDSYVSINEALKHAAASFGRKIEIKWIDTEEIENNPASVDVLKNFDGILMTPGFGKRGVEGMILSACYAIKEDIPYLGICFGAQILFSAFCRDCLGLEDANSTEIKPETCNPVVDLLPEQRDIVEKGGTMRLGGHDVIIKKGTILFKAYNGQTEIKERFRHRFHIMPKYAELANEKGLIVSAHDKTGKIINAIELNNKKWIVGVQFHPEYKSRPNKPSPLYVDFIKNCLN